MMALHQQLSHLSHHSRLYEYASLPFTVRGVTVLSCPVLCHIHPFSFLLSTDFPSSCRVPHRPPTGRCPSLQQLGAVGAV
jgi:hypothetical protein